VKLNPLIWGEFGKKLLSNSMLGKRQEGELIVTKAKNMVYTREEYPSKEC
jgi:hypothetical protein